MAPTVLFVVNDPTSTAALLGDVFTEFGFDIATFDVVPFDRVDKPAGDISFPDPTHYDVIVSLGARWPVYDDALKHTWVGTEMAMLRDADAAGIGVLGVCFGGQLIAQAHGGTVARSPAPEIGWYSVATDAPDVVPGGRWFQWHFDRWTVPAGARELARNGNASQAFVLGRSLALQFHPELDRRLLQCWVDDDRDGEAASLGVDTAELFDRTAEVQRDAGVRLRTLVRGFLDGVARDAPSWAKS